MQGVLCFVLLLNAGFKMPALMWSGLFLESLECSLQCTGDTLSSLSVMFPFSRETFFFLKIYPKIPSVQLLTLQQHCQELVVFLV